MVFEARLAGQHCLFPITSYLPKALIQAKTIAGILVLAGSKQAIFCSLQPAYICIRYTYVLHDRYMYI